MSVHEDSLLSVTGAQVRAFQVGVHHLDERAAGENALADVAGVCRVQDSPPGSAAMAVNARMVGLTPEAWEQAMAVDRTLVRTWAMRGAPFVVPSVDLPVFTTGVLPVDEEGRANLVYGVRQSLDDFSMGLDDFVVATADALPDVLAGERLDIHELGRRVAEAVTPTLSDDDRDAWDAEGPHAKGQPLGEAVVHFCIRILTLQQVLCFAPREGRTAPFVLLSEWLDDVPTLTGDEARRVLVTHYMRAYGPSSRSGLANWLGVNSSDAAAWWHLVGDDLVPVEVDGARRWLFADHVEALEASGQDGVEGVRLLPPGDPFLQVVDREVLVPDRERQKQLWRSLHAPGAVLVDGDVIGTWRGRKQSSRLEVTVDPFESLPSTGRDAIVDEAQTVAHVRDTTEATVQFADPSDSP